MKLILKFFLSIVLLQGGLAMGQVAGGNLPGDSGGSGTGAVTRQLSTMSKAQKQQEQEYFGAHSFEFSSIFKSHHPGPYWILAKTKQFELSDAQIKQQEELKIGMAKSTIIGNVALRKAYEKYATDASATAPSLAVLKQDIEDIGKAQTHLAQVMVPYHLNAYAALNPAQQTLYRKLVAEQK